MARIVSWRFVCLLSPCSLIRDANRKTNAVMREVDLMWPDPRLASKYRRYGEDKANLIDCLAWMKDASEFS